MISGIVFVFIPKLQTPSKFWKLNPQPHPSPFTRFYDRETATWAHCPNDNMDLQGQTRYISQNKYQHQCNDTQIKHALYLI